MFKFFKPFSVMVALRILFILTVAVTCGYSQPPASNSNNNCNQIEVELSVEHSLAGQQNGKVAVKLIKGDSKSIKYIFCEKNGKVLNELDFKNPAISGLKKGEYLVIISTDECSKKLAFKID